MNFPIILNSVNGIKKSESHDFTISFSSGMNLDPNKKYYLALDKLNMSYLWYNISTTYGNNKIKYSHDDGTTWSTIVFPNGNYSYQDLNYYIQEVIKENKHTVSNTEVGVSLSFESSVFKVLVTLSDNYKIDLQEGKFNDLIGFDKVIINKTSYNAKLPNITNSIDSLMLRCSLLSESIVSGIESDVLYQFSVDNLPLSYPFHIEPKRALFSKINSNIIKEIRIYITDMFDRPVDLNNIPISMTLLLKTST